MHIDSKPCRICQERGLQKIRCIICGWRQEPRKRKIVAVEPMSKTTVAQIEDPVLKEMVIGANASGYILGVPVTFRGQRREINEEEVKRRKRMDFYGRLYNQMMKYRMWTTGLVAWLDGSVRVIVCSERHQFDNLITVMHNDGFREVVDRKRAKCFQNNVDEIVYDFIGDPLAPDAVPYVPYYKEKKNEVQ